MHEFRRHARGGDSFQGFIVDVLDAPDDAPASQKLITIRRDQNRMGTAIPDDFDRLAHGGILKPADAVPELRPCDLYGKVLKVPNLSIRPAKAVELKSN
ncbi:hypothetical protein ABAC402_14490 [Asticcacaulis sp. AC402]|nr:hypothetical protein ABAC402_14490 [Asticcacaulis sp. AC402]